MKLLTNERQYRRWATGKDGWDTYKTRWRNMAPTQYPAYAYTIVSDWGMEETEPRYLYLSDVCEMVESLLKHTEVE